MAMAKILLVDDDVRLSEVIDDWLTAESHVVEYQSDGRGGWEKMTNAEYDVIILDWNLPDASGPDLCRRFRDTGKTTPVLLLTGRANIENKVEGLDSGADDYLTKPFSPKELSARLRALLRRFSIKPVAGDVLNAGNLTMDRKARTVTCGGAPVHLLPREFALLEFFMLNPEQVFSANEIMDNVWSEDNESSPDTVRVHITKLRGKLAAGGDESPIKTVHRVGYKFSSPS
jgi:DNA-binding response OmpR family regulator